MMVDISWDREDLGKNKFSEGCLMRVVGKSDLDMLKLIGLLRYQRSKWKPYVGN
jgi:hypothetical protein